MNRVSLVLGLVLPVLIMGCQSQTGPSGPMAQESSVAPPAARTIRSHPFVTQWTIPGSVSSHNYCSLAVDPAGNVYMADVTANRITKYDPNGQQLAQWGSTGTGPGQFQSPYSIAIDPGTSYVYVADSGNHRIQKFSSNGVFLSTYGSKGSGLGQFFWPEGIGVARWTVSLIPHVTVPWVYVADTGNNRMVKINENGIASTQWGSLGTGNGQFNTPLGNIAIQYTINSHQVFVTDSHNNRMQYFGPDGKYVGQFGTLGSGQGQLNLPFGIGMNGINYNFFIADWRNSRIQEFDLSSWATLSSAGANPPTFSPTGQALGVAVSSQFIYVADPDNHRILKFQF